MKLRTLTLAAAGVMALGLAACQKKTEEAPAAPATDATATAPATDSMMATTPPVTDPTVVPPAEGTTPPADTTTTTTPPATTGEMATAPKKEISSRTAELRRPPWAAVLLGGYSTVTDLARFRGWSTSAPLWTAT